MSTTAIATGNAIAVKRWDSKFVNELPKKVFFAGMAGPGDNNVVQIKNDLTKQPGDRITIPLRMNLSGAGVTGDSATIEGAEEPLTFYSDNITVDVYYNAVRLDGPMTEQRAPADLRKEARDALSTWAGEKVDTLGFTAIESSPTAIYTEISDALVLNGSTASVTLTDVVEPGMCSFLRTYAATASPKVKPIMQGGREMFVLLLHPHSAYDMRVDTTWQNFHRDADVRSPKDNYLFKHGLGQIDDVLLYEHENVAVATDWGGSSVNGARNKFLGAQAMALAWAKFPYMVEKRFEYGTQYGAMVGFVVGFRKLVFNSKDFGLIELRTARTAIGS